MFFAVVVRGASGLEFPTTLDQRVKEGMVFMKRYAVVLMSMVALANGCASTGSSKPATPAPRAHEVPPLRVGVTPNFPPMIFNQQGELAGVEVDLMKMVGRDLGRPVQAVILPWDEIIDELLSGKVDVIMSGMTITEARKMRMAFTDSWMNSGLMAMMRQKDTGQFNSAADIAQSYARIGVLARSTGHDYVRKNCPNAKLVRIASAGDAAVQLQRNRLDLYIDDIPSILWQVSSYEAELAVMMERLTIDQIAWGVRRDDTALTAQLNEVIRRRKQDGSIDAVLLKWLPYYESIK